MQAIEFETRIDKNGHIYLSEEFRHAYGKLARLVVLLPEQSELPKKNDNREVLKEYSRYCPKTTNTWMISWNTCHETFIGHAGIALVPFLVPKPWLGNASAPEAPASGRLPSREAGEPPRQVRSQAGAWEREKPEDVAGWVEARNPAVGFRASTQPTL